MDLGQDLAEITAGIDHLYRTTPRSDGFLDREGLIPVAVAPVTARQFGAYDDARAALDALSARIPSGAETAVRAAYLAEMVDSLHALIDTFTGVPITFAERLQRQMRVDTTVVPQAILDGYRQTIRDALDEMGYRGGDLPDDLAQWEADNAVPRDKVLAVMAELQIAARARVMKIMDPALTAGMADEWMDPQDVSGAPFSAYCDYPTRRMLINLDFPYTRFGLKHLATHEAFPGHTVHLKHREMMVAAGKMPLDGAQVVTSSASSALFEGIADNGIFFLDWVEGPSDVLGVALQRLRSATRCNAAWMMHAEGKSLDEIVPVIAAQAFQTPETARGRLAFLTHDLRMPFVYAYWSGDQAVHAAWTSLQPEQRGAFWRDIYGTMHTPRTLASVYG
ncbi:hypothetical protein BVG79_01292 [Ketogulonicigenium robustum]|uniref:DUF885 domain-containing protein n=1 Tax=Ketogulonicigenium robustum TaxID=92947 RepID=A0A1W6NZF4_9RHOB|nr:hypothetical protein [Ketogulonicigenium robustum]ARO14638.1 hypothetical protein BVG79_01292 [Ketogulonicigenium robustum]